MVAQVNSTYVRTGGPGRLWSRLLAYALFEGRPLTTRGQWINPVLSALFTLQTRLPQLKRAEAPVFILGTGRSGTTILGIVLSMHRHLGFLNEPKLLWHHLHGGEDLIGSYSRADARYRLQAGEATPERARDVRRMHGAYLALSGNSRVVDKYPEMIFRLPYLLALFPDARFLFLSRDGWDTCGSIERWSDRLGQEVAGERHDWWGRDRRKWQLLLRDIVPGHADLAAHIGALEHLTDQRVMAAVEWIVTMREGLSLRAAHPQSLLHVPYEQLCSDPGGMLGQIGDFLGLPPDRRFLDYGAAVLRPAEPLLPFALPDYLLAPFEATQAALGHAPRQAA